MWGRGFPRYLAGQQTTTVPTRISDDERIQNLCRMFVRGNITSILNKLECQRKILNEEDFKTLLLSFVSTFNSAMWPDFVSEQREQMPKRPTSWSNPRLYTKIIKNDRDHYRILFYYILSVIEKYDISNTEAIWIEILKLSSTIGCQFFEYLYKNEITIPTTIRELFFQKLKDECSKQNEFVQSQFFQYGVIFPEYIRDSSSIHFLETLFSRLKLQEKSYINDFAPENFIRLMNTPEKLSLFLSFFSNYDVNRIDPERNLSVLEQLLIMQSYFYSQQSTNTSPFRGAFRGRHRSNRPTSVQPRRSELDAYPNDPNKYRTLRIINLLQQLINHGAQLSQPIFSDINLKRITSESFYLTSIGVYVLLSMNPNDLCQEKPSFQRDSDLILFILEYIKRFSEEYQNLILNYLPLTFSIIHKQRFRNQRRIDETEEDQQINDKLFQQSLSLKQWCRLKIRDHCAQRNISKLGLLRKLTKYCSYGFSESDFASECIKQVTERNGKASPNNITDRFCEFYLLEQDRGSYRGRNLGGHDVGYYWGGRAGIGGRRFFNEDTSSDSDDNDQSSTLDDLDALFNTVDE